METVEVIEAFEVGEQIASGPVPRVIDAVVLVQVPSSSRGTEVQPLYER
jgi:hypothetical protein